MKSSFLNPGAFHILYDEMGVFYGILNCSGHLEEKQFVFVVS